MAVKVTHYYKVGDFGADGIDRQGFVVGAVEVHQLNVHIIRLDLHHLILRVFHVSVYQTGVDVVPDKSQYSSFASVCSV